MSEQALWKSAAQLYATESARAGRHMYMAWTWARSPPGGGVADGRSAALFAIKRLVGGLGKSDH